jgi:hypothetical protein
MAMNRPTSSPPAIDPHRQLRIISIFAFIPALSLLLPCGMISHAAWPAVGIAPMFFSSLFQAITIGSKPRMLKTTVLINTLLAAFLLAILVPRYEILKLQLLAHVHVQSADLTTSLVGSTWQRAGSIGTQVAGCLPQLCSVLTARCLLLSIRESRSCMLAWEAFCLIDPHSMIHIYLALHGWIEILWTQWAHYRCCCHDPSGCLRLDSKDVVGGGDGGNDTAEQPILRFYDEQARPSSEFQTSGCNTPRMSQETLGSSTRFSGDLV